MDWYQVQASLFMSTHLKGSIQISIQGFLLAFKSAEWQLLNVLKQDLLFIYSHCSQLIIILPHYFLYTRIKCAQFCLCLLPCCSILLSGFSDCTSYCLSLIIVFAVQSLSNMLQIYFFHDSSCLTDQSFKLIFFDYCKHLLILDDHANYF